MNKQIIVSIFCAVALMGCNNEKSSKEASIFRWESVSLKDAGIDSVYMDSIAFRMSLGDYGNIDEVLIVRDGKIVFEKKIEQDYNSISNGVSGKMGCGYNACEDSTLIHEYNYYHPQYHPYYKGQDIHTLQSITKSVMSTIVGCAIQDGYFSSLETPVAEYLADYKIEGPIRQHYQEATIKDLLTMQLGVEWAELGLALEMETDVSKMELSTNWVEYVLTKSPIEIPGKVWNYNSGASQLLSQVIKSSTNYTIDEYARRNLFKRLGIEDFHWKMTPNGLPDTEGGLYLTARDLAKIGLLYLNDGMWQGHRVLPKGWVKESTQKHVIDIYNDGGKEGYGYQWWLTAEEEPNVIGLGYGNQILIINKETKTVIVAYSWNVFDKQVDYILTPLLALVS